jgi:hypothetical protein
MDFGYTIAKSIVGLYKALLSGGGGIRHRKHPPTPKIIIGNHAYVSDAFVCHLSSKRNFIL